MIRKIIPVMALFAVTNVVVGQSLQQVDAARDKLQKWVETRQVISKERADWILQKESLENTRELLKTELTELEQKLTELDAGVSQSDTLRAELTDKKQNFDKATESVRTAVADLEVKVKAMAKLFPANLAQQVYPLIRRMPADPYKPGKLTLGERLPNVVGIVNAAGKFNTTLHHLSETVKKEDGTEMQVDVLYWGMGIAFFVDGKNQYAGYKYPTANGWKQEERSELAPKVRALIDMYQRKNPNIEFIEVPTVIR